MVGNWKRRFALLGALLLMVSACGTQEVGGEEAIVEPAAIGQSSPTVPAAASPVLSVTGVDDEISTNHFRERRRRPWKRKRRWWRKSTTTTVVVDETTTTEGDDTTTTTTEGDDTTTTTTGGDDTTTTTDRETTTTRESTTTTQESTTTTTNRNERVLFAEDFLSPESVDRFNYEIFHRDDFGVTQSRWQADHAPIAGNDPHACSDPFQKRTISRGSRPAFNDDWHYRCAPGDSPAKAHLMTSIGDTSGYSAGAFSPAQSFQGVREVRWSVNITDLGNRQWTEVTVIPASQGMSIPCTIEWTGCGNDWLKTNRQLGSVSTSFFFLQPGINSGSGTNSDGQWTSIAGGDPALSDIRPRRQHFFRDNGNGTLTLGIEKPDGSFHEHSVRGSFPSGSVRVLFVDANYNPLKAESGRPSTFTWHWDDIEIIG